jgi:hypothetical protein
MTPVSNAMIVKSMKKMFSKPEIGEWSQNLREGYLG